MGAVRERRRGASRNNNLPQVPDDPQQELTEAEKESAIFTGGILEIVDDGYGFLRGESLLPGNNDVYVSQSQIRRFGLRTGDYVRGQVESLIAHFSGFDQPLNVDALRTFNHFTNDLDA